jgi:hypothetical protein
MYNMFLCVKAFACGKQQATSNNAIKTCLNTIIPELPFLCLYIGFAVFQAPHGNLPGRHQAQKYKKIRLLSWLALI